VGRSRYPGLSEEALRFDALVDDAVALARRLRQDQRLDGLVLVGHSEGALVAGLAAERAHALAVVCVAGAGQRASALIRKQLAGHIPAALEPAAMAALDALEQGTLAHDVPDDLVLLFRPSVQPYLVSWFRHDPARVLADLAVPVMLVHGGDDAQVSVSHARLLHAAQPRARLRVVEGMDHLLAIGGDAQAGVEVVARELQAWLRELPEFAGA
jgi:pimeloyl-ACP methyl ester carboxylesterase